MNWLRYDFLRLLTLAILLPAIVFAVNLAHTKYCYWAGKHPLESMGPYIVVSLLLTMVNLVVICVYAIVAYRICKRIRWLGPIVLIPCGLFWMCILYTP